MIAKNSSFAFEVMGAELEVEHIQFTSMDIDYRKADNFKGFITDYSFLAWGIIVMESDNGILWARQYGTSLIKSNDHGQSWAFVYEFEKPINAIYSDSYGNIFVAITFDRWASEGTGELHRSSDNGKTFYKVLDIKSGVTLRWNIASRNGTMFVSEYGFKGYGNNARRIYRSLDFGENWDIIFEPAPRVDYHNHKILITENDIIYQSIGDGIHARIIRSVDNGYSWEAVINRFHPTSAVVFETHILWGLDSGPWSGIARYDRNTGIMTRSLTLPYPFAGAVYDMAKSHGVVYAMFLSYYCCNHPASIFYSKDEGVTWNLLGRIERMSGFGIGLYSLVVDDKFGYIDFESPVYRDGIVEFFRGTLRFELLGQHLYENTAQVQIRSNIDASKPMVALTFDDGPNRYTPRILEAFQYSDARATFFVLGNSVRNNPEIVQEMYKMGLEILGHTWNHTRLTTIPEYEIKNQLIKTHEEIEKITGSIPKMFRAPHGVSNDTVMAVSEQLGFANILWSVCPMDWEVTEPEIISYRVLRDIQDGSIVLLHDTYATAEAIQYLVSELIARGFQLVTVSELFYFRGIEVYSGAVIRSAPSKGSA